VVLVTLRLCRCRLPLASLAHSLAAIHPAVPVAVGATGAAFALALTVGHALVLTLLMLGMIGRLGGRSGLRKGR